MRDLPPQGWGCWVPRGSPRLWPFLVNKTFSLTQLSQSLHRPGEANMAAAERVLRYIRGKHDKCLIFCDPDSQRRNILYGWVDSNFAADPDARRSITSYVMAMNGAPISWRSCRQGGVTLSCAEAEYIAASAAAQETVYVRSLLARFRFPQRGPTECGKTMPCASL